MIKILYLIDRIKAAGAQKHLIEVINGLDKTRFQPYLCLLEKSAAIAELAVPVYCLSVKRIYGISGARGLLKLIRLIRQEKFDIVHSYLFSENILGTIAAKMAGVKVMITSRRDTGMLVQGDWQHILAYRLTNRWVDKIICVSKAVKKVALAKEKVSPEKLEVIYNGVDVGKFSSQPLALGRQLKEKLGIREDEFVVGMIANFSWIKGHKEFMGAAGLVLREVPNTKFLLIGEGPLKESFKLSVVSTQLKDKFIFLGSRQDIKELISIMDISVNASYSEGMSNTILESMASGIPMVATAVDGNLETVADNQTGFLVSPKDSAAMAGAITKILKDRELAKKMSENAVKVAQGKFIAEKMIKNFENLYKELLKPKIAFVLSQFPETHETFILREFRALEEKGIDFKILSLKPCRDKVVHPEARALIGRTVYFAAHKLISSLAHIVLHPIGALGVFLYVLKSYYRQPKELIKALYVWLECFYFAQIIKKEKISHIHSHWATIPTTAAVIISKLTGLSYSFTAHAWDIFVNSNGLVGKIEKAKFVVTCTDYNKKYLRDLVARSQGRKVTNKIYRNYHGIDLNTFVNKNNYHPLACSSQLKILAIGRLVETKGFEYLIEACSILQKQGLNFECQIVGGGALRKKLELLVVSYQLPDRVRLLGTQTQEEIRRLFTEATIFVQPSVIAKDGDRDGIPNVIAEAMALGVPVIATDISGIPEAVITGQTGILVPERNSAALADAINNLLGNVSLRALLIKKGRQLLEGKFNIKRNIGELIDIFQENGVLN